MLEISRSSLAAILLLKFKSDIQTELLNVVKGPKPAIRGKAPNLVYLKNRSRMTRRKIVTAASVRT